MPGEMMARASVALAFLMLIGSLFAANATNSPGMVVNTEEGSEWSSPENAMASDDAYATNNVGVDASGALTATNFGFAIPAGAEINGILVEIERETNTTGSLPISDHSVQIIKSDGSIGSVNKASTEPWPPTDTYASYGGLGDNWDESWTPGDINDADFGVILRIYINQGGGGCLDGDSQISTENGYMKIKDIKAGDGVVSYNETAKKLEIKKTTDVLSVPISRSNNTYYNIYYNKGKRIKATGDHEFYVEGGYVEARNLKIGDRIFSIDGVEYAIENITAETDTDDIVWDLGVEGNHNFFANDILVHNYISFQRVDHIRITVYYTEAAPVDYNISSPRTISSGGAYNLNGSFACAAGAPCLNITASNVTINGNGFQINGTVLVSGARNVTISNLAIDPAIGLLVNNTNDSAFSNLTILNVTQYGIYVANDSNRNNFTNNSIDSAAGTLLRITDTSAGNIFRWNIFTSASGLYVNDTNGANFYNGSASGQNEGNLWANVLSGAVAMNGSAVSLYSQSYNVGSGGSGFPYNNTTSGGKFSCNAAGCGDYAPLYPLSHGMGGADATLAGNNRWDRLFTGNATMRPQGGNITRIIHPATLQLTDRWALFVGNVSGNIMLGNSEAARRVYTWIWSPVDSGGAVCATTSSIYNFLSIGGATGAEMDAAWGFASDAMDNGGKTFISGSCSVNLTQSSATAANRSKTGAANPDDQFYTCPLKSPAGTAVASGEKGKLAFCSPIMGSSGKDYMNASADFEIIAPTPYAIGGAGADVYYFFVTLD